MKDQYDQKRKIGRQKLAFSMVTALLIALPLTATAGPRKTKAQIEEEAKKSSELYSSTLNNRISTATTKRDEAKAIIEESDKVIKDASLGLAKFKNDMDRAADELEQARSQRKGVAELTRALEHYENRKNAYLAEAQKIEKAKKRKSKAIQDYNQQADIVKISQQALALKEKEKADDFVKENGTAIEQAVAPLLEGRDEAVKQAVLAEIQSKLQEIDNLKNSLSNLESKVKTKLEELQRREAALDAKLASASGACEKIEAVCRVGEANRTTAQNQNLSRVSTYSYDYADSKGKSTPISLPDSGSTSTHDESLAQYIRGE